MLDPAIQELLGYNSSHVLLTSHRYAGRTDTISLTNLRYRRIDRHQIFIKLLASHMYSYARIFGIQILSQTYGIVELIDTNALSLSVLQLSTSKAIALEVDNWEHAKGQACCPTFLLKDNGELEDNYARVSCCSGRGSDHERLKNFPNLPRFSCMLFYSKLEDNYTRASCCP